MSLVRKPAGEELVDLLDRVLDKGIVVEASSRLHLIGANFLSHKTHVVIASVEIHMRHSEARVVSKSRRRRPQRSEESEPAVILRNSFLR
jgi:gas vesicle structural protein